MCGLICDSVALNLTTLKSNFEPSDCAYTSTARMGSCLRKYCMHGLIPAQILHAWAYVYISTARMISYPCIFICKCTYSCTFAAKHSYAPDNLSTLSGEHTKMLYKSSTFTDLHMICILNIDIIKLGLSKIRALHKQCYGYLTATSILNMIAKD